MANDLRTKYIIRRSINEEQGSIRIIFIVKCPWQSYKKKGWLSGGGYHFQIRAFEKLLDINLVNGYCSQGLIDHTIRDNFSYFKNSVEALKKTDWVRENDFLPSIGPWETVNAHQWEGDTPISIKGTSAPFVEIDRELALWDVAAVNNQHGDRILFTRTHARRDSVFQIQNILNNITGHCQSWIAPYAGFLEGKEAMTSVAKFPEAEREKGWEMFHDLKAKLAAHRFMGE